MSKQGAAIVVHGGAGASIEYKDGCENAANAGARLLTHGAGALDAVVGAVTVLEDDGRFNAGSGAQLGLDGQTIEMDASVMQSDGRQGAVACITRVKNPVQVARGVLDTPHCLLCGEGAQRLARVHGHGDYYHVTEKARLDYQEMLAKMDSGSQARPGVENSEFIRLWNFPAPPAFSARACDTVGAVARDAGGHFAVAGSTGGSAPALLGRVGDTALVGSGFYAGPLGAIAATGIGEHIIRHLLAREVYQWLADGMPLDLALQRGVDLFDKNIDIGLIGVSADAVACRSNRDMPTARWQA
ncbi:MAG TPA: isoaspartyl peptidase/L-asparaginase [Telluria sp.]|jgi:L-asparaginase/beta-aspartyl-peptidase (threonine type)